MKTFRDLLIWQKAMSLVTKCYRTTNKLPKEEFFALASQIKRCSVSIPSNIAEGFGRGSSKDYRRFLNIAMGSLFELQTQMEIAFNLGYISEADFTDLYNDSGNSNECLSAFIKKVKESLT